MASSKATLSELSGLEPKEAIKAIRKRYCHSAVESIEQVKMVYLLAHGNAIKVRAEWEEYYNWATKTYDVLPKGQKRSEHTKKGGYYGYDD